MATLIIEYRLPTDAVSDFADWKVVFDEDPVGRKAHGATRHSIHQEVNDSNHFMVTIEFPTVDQANGFLSEPTLKQSWRISGARESWVLEEVEAVAY